LYGLEHGKEARAVELEARTYVRVESCSREGPKEPFLPSFNVLFLAMRGDSAIRQGGPPFILSHEALNLRERDTPLPSGCTCNTDLALLVPPLESGDIEPESRGRLPNTQKNLHAFNMHLPRYICLLPLAVKPLPVIDCNGSQRQCNDRHCDEAA
jgi:hypothetical protein